MGNFRGVIGRLRGPWPWIGLLAVTAAVMVMLAVGVLSEEQASRPAKAAGLASSHERQAHHARRSGDPSEARPVKRPVTLEWVGDMAMSSELGLPPGGVAEALAPLAPTLRDADVTLGNLEGTLSVGGTSKCGAAGDSATCFAFQAPPATAFDLRRLGFDLVNQANNHAQDYGPDGHAQTLAALRHAGLVSTGDPGQITYLTRHGVRIAFLGFAPYTYTSNLLNVRAAEAFVRQATRHATLVVVIIHAGAEGADQLHTPTGTQYF
jgi:hypothetical protein